jgi:hypothetical protein
MRILRAIQPTPKGKTMPTINDLFRLLDSARGEFAPELELSEVPPELREEVLREIRETAGLPGAGEVDRYALRSAFLYLSQEREEDSSATSERRKLLGQIGAGMGDDPTPPNPYYARAWFQAQVDAWTGSINPVLAARALVAQRELGEIEERGGDKERVRY